MNYGCEEEALWKIYFGALNKGATLSEGDPLISLYFLLQRELPCQGL
jgi:hypothetical protein